MLRLDSLKRIPNLIHAFSGVKEGNMSFDFGEQAEVSLSRERFFEKAGAEQKNYAVMLLTHGTEIAVADGFPGGNTFKADCVITKSKNLFVAVLTADCMPLIAFEPKTGVLAVAHLSRINSPKGFARKIIERMKSEFGAAPEKIIAGVGPCIHKESYIFDAAVLEKVMQDRKIFGGFISEMPDGKKSVDLIGYNVQELISAGVPEENIEISGADTAADRNFFSHRRSQLTGEKEGRMLTMAGIAESITFQ